MNIASEFLSALEDYKLYSETMGHDHPVTRRAWILVFELAPEEFKEEAGKVAREMDLLPTPSSYTADGKPLYRLDDVVAKLDMTTEEAESYLQEVIADREILGLPTMELVTNQPAYRVH